MIKLMLFDGAALGYLFIFLLCVYGLGLFAWGLMVAKKQGWHVSIVYLYMMGMFSSLGYFIFYAIINRYQTLTDPSVSYLFRQTNHWGTRAIPLTIILLLIVGHMTYRAFWLRFEADKK
jgi:hypothetical protein